MPPPRPKIGEYRHTPGDLAVIGPDGVARPARTRRRFRHLGLVFLAYGMLGPLGCWGVAGAMKGTVLRAYIPARLSELPLPAQPSLQNVLFGAGLHELVLASALAGLLLWRSLWGTRLPPGTGSDLRGALWPLVAAGLVRGPLILLAGIPIAAFGLFIRTGPGDIPPLVKPFFALLSVPFVSFSALFTGVIPLTVVLLGLAFGAVTGLAVAVAWQSSPEENDPPRRRL